MAAIAAPLPYRSRRQVVGGGGAQVGHQAMASLTQMWMMLMVVMVVHVMRKGKITVLQLVGMQTTTIVGGGRARQQAVVGSVAAAMLYPRHLLHDGHELEVLGVLALVLQGYLVPELARISRRRSHVN